MKRCNECKMDVNTDRLTCPLCFQTLVEKTNEEVCELYPKHKVKKGKSNLFYKIVCFICLIAILATCLINYATYNDNTQWWCLYVVLSSGYVYFLVRGAILTHSYVVKRLFFQLISISILVWGVDKLSGYEHWSIEYVIPFLCILTNLTITIIALVNKKNYGEGFNCMLLSLLIGLIPFILSITLKDNFKSSWAPLASLFVSISIFLGMFIFANSQTKEEFKKRLHF